MGEQPGDDKLLARYAGRRDQAAFGELVRRHLDLVYSAAVRRVGDAHVAEDVAQAVFLTLARRPDAVRAAVPLSAWLLTTVRYAAANARRVERRRRRHEGAAAAAAEGAGACSANPIDVLVWQEVASELDDAVLRLSAVDRRAILLRFYEQRPIGEIARALGTTEAAAGMRVARALGKLRNRLNGLGSGFVALALPTLTSLLEAHVVRRAPRGLSGSTAALVAHPTPPGGVATALMKGAIAMMTRTKIKTIAACVAVAAFLGIGGAVAVIGAGATRPATTSTPPSTRPFGEVHQVDNAPLDVSPTPSDALQAWFKATNDGDQAAAGRRALVRSATGYCEAYARWHFASLRLSALTDRKRLGSRGGALSPGFVKSVPIRSGALRLLDTLRHLQWKDADDGRTSILVDPEWRDVGFGNLSAQRVNGGWVVVLTDQDDKYKPAELERARKGLDDTAIVVERATERVDAGTLTNFQEINDFMTTELARLQGGATTQAAPLPATSAKNKPTASTTRAASTRPTGFRGTLVRVDGRSLVLQPMDGPVGARDLTMTLPDDAKLMIDGDRGTLPDLKPGMEVVAAFTRPPASDAKSPTGAVVNATSPSRFGIVASVDGDGLFLDVPSGSKPFRVQTDPKTRVLFLGQVIDGKLQEGGERQLVDLKPGMRVKIAPPEGTAVKILAVPLNAGTHPTTQPTP